MLLDRKISRREHNRDAFRHPSLRSRQQQAGAYGSAAFDMSSMQAARRQDRLDTKELASNLHEAESENHTASGEARALSAESQLRRKNAEEELKWTLSSKRSERAHNRANETGTVQQLRKTASSSSDAVPPNVASREKSVSQAGARKGLQTKLDEALAKSRQLTLVISRGSSKFCESKTQYDHMKNKRLR